METIVLRAHFDGKQILLDEPYELLPNTHLLVTVIKKPDTEQMAWLKLSAEGLNLAYGEDEPEYPPDLAENEHVEIQIPQKSTSARSILKLSGVLAGQDNITYEEIQAITDEMREQHMNKLLAQFDSE